MAETLEINDGEIEATVRQLYSISEQIKKLALTTDFTKPIKKFGKWKVSLKGDMTYDKGRYSIHHKRLKENNWIIHLSEKHWIDFNEFIPAYLQALKNANIQFLEIMTFYTNTRDEKHYRKKVKP